MRTYYLYTCMVAFCFKRNLSTRRRAPFPLQLDAITCDARWQLCVFETQLKKQCCTTAHNRHIATEKLDIMLCFIYYFLGNFAFINVHESGMTSGDVATLSITGLGENITYCLTFYRHMYGSHIGSLRVNMMCCHYAVERHRCKSIYIFISNQVMHKTIWIQGCKVNKQW